MATTLNITLQNQTQSAPVYAFITGTATANSNALFILQADGQTPYYPASPASVGTALAENCAIDLGASGNSVTVTIPYLAGARIWFSVLEPITFLLNPGPALVEPSVTNPSDPNIALQWAFCEFTFSSAQLFINLSYVDFFGLPISLTTTDTNSQVQHVSGTIHGARNTIAANLRAQETIDSQPWSNLIVNNPDGSVLRVLSPNNGIVMNSTLFSGYYPPYVDQVWTKYTGSTNLVVDTQAQWGTLDATVVNNLLTFAGGITFAQPTTANVFSCQGVFDVTSVEQGAIAARLAAAFNRSTLLTDVDVPSTPDPGSYYQTSPTNHYARIVHAANLDGRGYCFPYDDVTPDGGVDQSGSISVASPSSLVLAVGGVGAYA